MVTSGHINQCPFPWHTRADFKIHQGRSSSLTGVRWQIQVQGHSEPCFTLRGIWVPPTRSNKSIGKEDKNGLHIFRALQLIAKGHISDKQEAEIKIGTGYCNWLKLKRRSLFLKWRHSRNHSSPVWSSQLDTAPDTLPPTLCFEHGHERAIAQSTTNNFFTFEASAPGENQPRCICYQASKRLHYSA